jgi:hypothetical protein
MSRDGQWPADTIAGMGRASLGIAVGLILGTAGVACRPAAAPPVPSAAQATEFGSLELASLPRDRITLAQRANWRSHLRWADDCEESFVASHVGDGGGISVVRLGSGVSLVEVTCAAGAYQPSTLRFRLTEDANGARTDPLSFPVYVSENGRDLTVSQEAEVWGESMVDGAAAEIVILSLGRQTADCGVWARYSLAGEQPRLLDAAARTECPAQPGPPARLSGASPPADWTPIPRKD